LPKPEWEPKIENMSAPYLIPTNVCDRSPAPGYPIEPRGVYVARYLSPKGNYILNCIDRRGRHVAQVVVADPERWVEFQRAAAAILDEIDPGLTLI